MRLNLVVSAVGRFPWLVLCLWVGVSAARAELLPSRVAETAQERVAAGINQTIVFGVVDGDRSEVVAFGKLDDGKSPDGSTVYEIGSVSKTFTATLLAEAVQSGRVTLDTPVAQLVPDFQIPERDGKQITLGLLATHYSGLPMLPSNLSKDPANPYENYDAASFKTFLAGYQLQRVPGAAYQYSNVDYGLLGYALGRSMHTTYEALLKKEILQPLGMTMTGVAFSEAMLAHLAPGHRKTGAPEKNWDLGVLAGCGGIRSTADDMLRYLKANMGIDQPPLMAAMKFAQQPRAEMNQNSRIGLGWYTNWEGVIGHEGGTGGYRSFLGFVGRRGIIVLTNTAADVADLGNATLIAQAPLPQRPAMLH
jgi:CubicO group peptidase (beta-lactamase class C family)